MRFDTLILPRPGTESLPDRWHWLPIGIVCASLPLAWALKYPGELQEFQENPLSMAPYWMLYSGASFCLAVYLERALRSEPSAAFRGFAAAVVSMILSSLCFALDARAASGPVVALIYVALAMAGRATRTPLRLWPERVATIENVRAIFFLSGAAALLYQVVWQWRLMSFLGANSESVAVIVAVFMAGLGIGGYLGGLVARTSRRGLILFLVLEVGIGLWGIASLPLLDIAVAHSASVPQGPALIVLVGALLLPPTILMGATLPILVELMRANVPAMNENVGKLYSINALGSAAAAVLSVAVLFPFVGQTTVTIFAAGLNGIAAILVWLASRAWKATASSVALASSVDERKINFELDYWLVGALAMLTGFVTIGQEVLLLRQASWLTGGRPEVFGFGVGVFLFGLASGSWRQTSITRSQLTQEASKNWFLLAAVIAGGPFLASYASAAGTIAGLVVILGTLFASGYLGARSLPMIAGLLRVSDQKRFGNIYLANIAGSVGGSLVLGYWLADFISLSSLLILSACLSFVIGVAFHWSGKEKGYKWDPKIGGRALVAICALLIAPTLSDRWLERMLLQEIWPNHFMYVGYSRSGIVAVNLEGARKVVYGGGIYDGAISAQVRPDLNGIGRLYRALALHDNPAQVLEIGLSSGSWARGILLDERVASLVSVEINPAYASLVAGFDEVRPILEDRRFKVVSDDGRRWMRLRDSPKFDMIVSNTTYHWRSGATLITSREFMNVVRSRLQPGGIFVINTTGSENVTATTCEAFKHCVLIGNVVAASDRPMDLSFTAARNRLSRHEQFRHMDEELLRSWLQAWSVTVISEQAAGSKVITDDAMTDEYRRR